MRFQSISLFRRGKWKTKNLILLYLYRIFVDIYIHFIHHLVKTVRENRLKNTSKITLVSKMLPFGPCWIIFLSNSETLASPGIALKYRWWYLGSLESLAERPYLNSFSYLPVMIQIVKHSLYTSGKFNFSENIFQLKMFFFIWLSSVLWIHYSFTYMSRWTMIEISYESILSSSKYGFGDALSLWISQIFPEKFLSNHIIFENRQTLEMNKESE